MPSTDLDLARAFAGLTDPRIDRTKLHPLTDIVVIALCAVICGADSWLEVEEFGHAKHDWLKRFLKLPNGIPATTRSPAWSPLSTRPSSRPASPPGWRPRARPPG